MVLAAIATRGSRSITGLGATWTISARALGRAPRCASTRVAPRRRATSALRDGLPLRAAVAPGTRACMASVQSAEGGNSPARFHGATSRRIAPARPLPGTRAPLSPSTSSACALSRRPRPSHPPRHRPNRARRRRRRRRRPRGSRIARAGAPRTIAPARATIAAWALGATARGGSLKVRRHGATWPALAHASPRVRLAASGSLTSSARRSRVASSMAGGSARSPINRRSRNRRRRPRRR
jgi:hypothetical protein